MKIISVLGSDEYDNECDICTGTKYHDNREIYVVAKVKKQQTLISVAINNISTITLKEARELLEFPKYLGTYKGKEFVLHHCHASVINFEYQIVNVNVPMYLSVGE